MPKQPKTVAFDVETTGLNPHRGDKIFSFSVAPSSGEETTVHRLDGSKLRRVQGERALRRLWSDGNKRQGKTIHNAKFDVGFAEQHLGRRLDGHVIHCTHKMSHILNNAHPSHSLDDLCFDFAEYPRVDKEMKKLAKQCGGFQKVPETKMNCYQREDGFRGMLLYKFFYPKIKANPQYREIYKTEMDLIWATLRMEERGLMLHEGRTEKLISELNDKRHYVAESIYAVVGRHFKINSPDQLGSILYGKLGLPIIKRTKKAKKPSTDKTVLSDLRGKHPVIELIMEYRSLHRGVAILDSYLKLADSDGIIHPSINTCQAVTSRESCSDPNLQNVDKSAALLNPFPIPARRCFRPRPGYVNLHIDYSGIEMRLLIDVSKDPRMMECLISGDGGVHELAAERFFVERFIKERDAAKKKILRDASKNANFAIPYGASAAKVRLILGMADMVVAGAAYGRYQQAFPTLCGLSDIIAKWVYESGGVETAFGRFLRVPRDLAYTGTNYRIQGDAAGVLKRAQNRVHRYNEEKTGGEVRILLPIHDELVIEYPRELLKYLQDYLRDVRKLMLDFPMFSVPLEISVEISTSSWDEKVPVALVA